MSEGRRSQVILLDERRLDITIQSRLYAGELLDIVASHFSLKEKEYFGLAFIDDNGHYSWLQLEKRVLEHEFPKKYCSQGATLLLYFRIKYFVESITHLHDSATIEAFYLQVKSLIAKGELEIDSETVFQLAALVIQATYGDYTDDQTFKLYLKKVPVLPLFTLKEQPCISVCEENALKHYKDLIGQTRGAAIVNYLSIIESLPTYGHHYYEVKEKGGASCWLGLSYRGISQYDKNDRHIPRRVFLWKQLENLYFRDRKFTIEVHEARRVVHTLSSFNLYEDAIEEPEEKFDDLSNAICDPTTQVSVSRRTLAPANVTVYVWYAPSPHIAKCIWSMAISQHQFFLDRNHWKNRTSIVRSLSQIASELCRSSQSLSSASSLSNISRSNSSTSLPTIIIEGELSEESKAATVEMLNALQSRKDALEDALKKKTEELKTLCLKEGELTGEIPPETPLNPGEAKPQIRRRVGTSFTLSDKFICSASNKDRQTLNDLELDYEIQSKIASAAFKLANDVTARKSVRKLRKTCYQQATNKLRDIEQKLCTLKREKDSQKKERELNNGLATALSDNSLSERSSVDSSSKNSFPPFASLPQLTENMCISSPPSPAKQRQRHQSLQHVPIITTEVYDDANQNFEPQTRNSSSFSAASEYDSISCDSSIASLGVNYRNRFESSLNIEGTNHYSVPNRRASQVFDDPDDLLVNENLNSESRCFTEDASLKRHVHSIPLSSSYDERLIYRSKSGLTIVPNDHSELDCSYDDLSLNGVLGLNCPNHLSNQENTIRKKFSHSCSENSLHQAQDDSLHLNLDCINISDPKLNIHNTGNGANIPHVHTLPMVKNNSCTKSNYIDPSNVTCMSYKKNQSISQVADLVQASILLQDSKRVSSSSLYDSNSPKTKTKEWVETSLDSPFLGKRRKSKPHDNLRIENCPVHWEENGLPSVVQAETNSTNVDIDQNHYGNLRNIHVNNITLKKSPPPCPPSYDALYSSDFSGHYDSKLLPPLFPKVETENPKRHSFSSAHLFPNTDHCYDMNASSNKKCHADDEPEKLYKNIDNSKYYENHSVLSNFEAHNNEQLSEIYEFGEPVVSLSVAEPQKPSKNRKYKCTRKNDTFLSHEMPDMHETRNIDDYNFDLLDIAHCNHPVSLAEMHCSSPEPSSHYSFKSEYDATHSKLGVASSAVPVEEMQSQQCHFSAQNVNNTTLSPSIPHNLSFSPNVEVNIVSVGHFQPYWEETKPYELSDFYKYSTKHRKHKKSSDLDEIQECNKRESNDDSSFVCISQRKELFHDVDPSKEDMPHWYNAKPLSHHEELDNISMKCDDTAFGNISGNEDGAIDTLKQNLSSHDKSLSFGEEQFRISLADTFHDEMLSWYQQNQETTVKKATLV